MDKFKIRNKAEEKLKEVEYLPETPKERDKLIHELQVHQVELEIQNEELHRVQSELEKSKARFEDLYDYAPVGYFTFDELGFVIDLNLTAVQVFDCARIDILKTPFTKFIDPKYHSIFFHHLKEASFAKKRVTCELELHDKKNNHFSGRLVSWLFEVPETGKKLCRSVLTDISDLKKVENELLESRNELEKLNHSLEERVKEEVQKNREKERIIFQQARYASIGELLSMIAHQWRQPLSTISTATIQLSLADSMGDSTPESRKELLSFIEKQTQDLSKIIDDFRNSFSPATQKTKFKLEDLVADIGFLMDGQLSKYKIELTDQIDKNLEIYGYSRDLKQVLLVLISNSIDAYQSGSQSSRTITIRGKKQNKGVQIEVEDQAGGIPKSIADKVFDPFFSTKEEGKGAGIGLYMARTIVEKNLDGQLVLQSEGNKSCFQILI